MAISYKRKDLQTEEFRQSLLSSGFPPILLKNASSEVNLDGEAVKGFIAKAQEYAGNSAGFERLVRLTEFVYRAIPYDDSKLAYPMLEEILSGKSGGVCLHKAAALQLVLVYEGWNTKGEGGTATYKEFFLGPHAWLQVSFEGENYLLDPTNMLAGKYSEFKISSVPFGIIQKTEEHKGVFNLLRKIRLLHQKLDETKIEVFYENLWDWYPWGLDYVQNVPKEVIRDYLDFIGTAERIKSIVEQHGALTKQDLSAIQPAYSRWVSTSHKKLDELKQSARK